MRNAETVNTFERDGFEVRILHAVDESPDLSHLGEYWTRRDTPPFPYYDRALRRVVKSYAELVCQTCDGSGVVTTDCDVEHADGVCPSHEVDCTACGGSGSMLSEDERRAVERWSSREWRFITPGAGDTDYLKEDAERLERYGDDWHSLGVIAQAFKADVMLGESNGVWGIESDSDAAHFREMAEQEASDAIHAARAKLAELETIRKRRPKDAPSAHLYESGATSTLCGKTLHRMGAVSWIASDGWRALHISKARKSDCAECRTAYRRALVARR